MKNRNLLIALVVAVLVPFTSPASAEEDDGIELRLHQSGAGTLVRDDGFGWLADDTPVFGRFEVGVGATVIPGLTVLGEFSWGAAYDTVLDGADSELQSLTGGARVRLAMPIDFIVKPYLTAGAGLLVGHYALDGGERRLSDTAFGIALDSAMGVEVQSRGRFSVGGFMDYGYAWRSKLRFEAEASDGLRVDPVDLGTLQLSGFQFRFGAFLSYRL